MSSKESLKLVTKEFTDYQWTIVSIKFSTQEKAEATDYITLHVFHQKLFFLGANRTASQWDLQLVLCTQPYK